MDNNGWPKNEPSVLCSLSERVMLLKFYIVRLLLYAPNFAWVSEWAASFNINGGMVPQPNTLLRRLGCIVQSVSCESNIHATFWRCNFAYQARSIDDGDAACQVSMMYRAVQSMKGCLICAHAYYNKVLWSSELLWLLISFKHFPFRSFYFEYLIWFWMWIGYATNVCFRGTNLPVLILVISLVSRICLIPFLDKAWHHTFASKLCMNIS